MIFKVVMDDGMNTDMIKFGESASVPVLLDFDTSKPIGRAVLSHDKDCGIVADVHDIKSMYKLHNVLNVAPTVSIIKQVGNSIEGARIISVSPIYKESAKPKKREDIYFRLKWWAGDKYQFSQVMKTSATSQQVNDVMNEVVQIEEYCVDTFINKMKEYNHFITVIPVVDFEDF